MTDSPRQERLIQFLREDLAVPVGAIALALKHCAAMPNCLPMTLWQYGLITIDQVAQIFDWLESA
ncbi:DUF2949 domain-containing protein [Altericista sp. CCNU0014]|uniref:DUF2949 domain-containing protein n=1 Tax=Altericista sp. CCNU0014 TaxID=3082949 RepID=UPI00384F3235